MGDVLKLAIKSVLPEGERSQKKEEGAKNTRYSLSGVCSLRPEACLFNVRSALCGELGLVMLEMALHFSRSLAYVPAESIAKEEALLADYSDEELRAIAESSNKLGWAKEPAFYRALYNTMIRRDLF